MNRTSVDYEKPSAGITRSVSKGKNRGVYRPEGMVGWVLNATTEGEGRINRGEKSFRVKRGDLLLFPPHIAHDYDYHESEGAWTHLWVYFSPDPMWEELLSWPESSQGIGRLRITHEKLWRYIEERFVKLVQTSHLLLSRRSSIVMAMLEEILLWCQESHAEASPTYQDPRIQKAIAFIGSNLADNLSVAKLATSCGLSSSRFAHLFKEELGETPVQVIEKIRLKRAGDMLTISDKPIAQIAKETGFNSPYYFSRVFSKHYGVSPRGFRSRV